MRLKITILILFLFNSICHAQKFKISLKDSTKLEDPIAMLSEQLLLAYEEKNKETYLDNLFRIQLTAKKYQESINTLDTLREVYREQFGSFADVIGIRYEAYARTKIVQKQKHTSFEKEFESVLSHIYNNLNKNDVDDVAPYFDTNLQESERSYYEKVAELKTKDSLSIDDARRLCRSYLLYKTQKATAPIALAFLQKEEDKRYIIKDSLLINTKDNAQLSAIVIRQREITKPLPTILIYNIYAGPFDKSDAKSYAKQGYVGVVANTRGKKRSPQDIEPFEHDGRDAFEILEWISKQSWSNGEVGMIGGSYLGFAQWASTKKMHPALKTIIPQVSVGIGIDYPIHNGIFSTYMLKWIHYVENNKLTDNSVFENGKEWDSLDLKMFRSNKSFRALDTLQGRPNKIFQRWLDHPKFDNFWQNMIPQKKEFSKIDIPILSITGYFDDDQLGALYYYDQHHKYNKDPQHYLLIGPYDHGGAQGYPRRKVQGYTIDSVANIKIKSITDSWFNYILKDSLKPEILKDKVNYQVMGLNKWKHKPSLRMMNSDTLKLYLSNTHVSGYYNLASKKPDGFEFIKQEVDFLNRDDATPYGTIAKKVLDSVLEKQNGLTFISKSFNSEFEINGNFIGKLNLMINKKDFDLDIKLYELRADNTYFFLSGSFGRASLAKNRSKRQLLRPNKKENIPIPHSYFTSKHISKGSRLVLVVSINKNPSWQVNYGSGKDVSNETILDAKEPLQIKWYNDSYIRVPIKK